MSITSPAADWFQKPTGGERTWLALAIAWCIVLSAMMPYWHMKGKQNSTGEAYSVKPLDFYARVQRFETANKVDERNGIPIVQPAPGSDIYLQAMMWQFRPILKLKKDQTYRLHVSSLDLQHGLSLQPLNMNFQILPGYDHVLTITPTMSGEFPIVCNEFCGIDHHKMTGRILVED